MRFDVPLTFGGPIGSIEFERKPPCMKVSSITDGRRGWAEDGPIGPTAVALALLTGSLPRCRALNGLLAELIPGLMIPE